jgi:tetratricopeptide (TPR) repeat protein
MLRGDLERAEDYDEQSLALCQEAQDWWGIAWSLYDLGYLAFAQGDGTRAQLLLEEGLARLREQGITYGIFRALFALGHVLLGQGDITQAKQQYQEGMALQLSEDGSNGYEAIASIYVAGRGTRPLLGDAIGAATVRAWAQAFPPGATVLDPKRRCSHATPLRHMGRTDRESGHAGA